MRKDYLYAIAGGQEALNADFQEFVEKRMNYSTKALTRMWNYITCEPHLEVLTTVISNLMEKELRGKE